MTLAAYLDQIIGLMQPKDGQHHPFTFIRQHGQSFAITERTFDGPRGIPGSCYMNAGVEAVNDPTLTYVEGFVLAFGVPIQHAWLLEADGTMRDPTLTGAENIGGYFGVPIKTAFLWKRVYRTRLWGLFFEQNWPAILAANPTTIVRRNDMTPTADDIKNFNAYLRNCTNRQVQNVYHKESMRGGNGEIFAELAKAEALRRLSQEPISAVIPDGIDALAVYPDGKAG